MTVDNTKGRRVTDPLRYLHIRNCTEFIVPQIPRIVHAFLKVLKGSRTSATTCAVIAAAVSGTDQIARPNRSRIKLAVPNVLLQAWPAKRPRLVSRSARKPKYVGGEIANTHLPGTARVFFFQKD